MPFDRDSDARQDIANQQRAVREIADRQMQQMGYKRTEGFTPAPRPQNPYQPGGERPKVSPPLEPSKPLVIDDNLKPRTERRSFGVGQGDQ